MKEATILFAFFCRIQYFFFLRQKANVETIRQRSNAYKKCFIEIQIEANWK